MRNKKPFEIILHVGRITSLQSWVAKKSCHGQTLINECSIFDHRYMYLKKAWYLKTYIDTNSSIDFESYIKQKTSDCLVLTRHQSSLKTNQISIGPYFLEIREEKGSC